MISLFSNPKNTQSNHLIHWHVLHESSAPKADCSGCGSTASAKSLKHATTHTKLGDAKFTQSKERRCGFVLRKFQQTELRYSVILRCFLHLFRVSLCSRSVSGREEGLGMRLNQTATRPRSRPFTSKSRGERRLHRQGGCAPPLFRPKFYKHPLEPPPPPPF